MKSIALSPLLLLAACGATPPATNDFAANVTQVEEVTADGSNGTMATTEYLGRWTGVEGMYLVVSPGTTPGNYTLEMQYDLDNKAVVQGRATAAGIVFERGGKPMTLKPTDGAATGLKYLDGKTDCLTVASGEGYCRG